MLDFAVIIFGGLEAVTRSQAVQHFQSVSKLAQALGITKQAVNAWGEQIPAKRQFELAQMTRGALLVDPDLVPQAGQDNPPAVGQALQNVIAALNVFHAALDHAQSAHHATGTGQPGQKCSA